MSPLGGSILPLRARRLALSLADFLSRWQWLAVLVLSPFLLLPSMSRLWLLPVLPAVWLLAAVSRRRLLLGTPLDWPLALLALMVLVSAWATYDIAVSLPKIAGVILGLGVYSVFAQFGRGRRGLFLLLSVFMAVGLGMALVGLLYIQWVSKLPLLGPLLAHLPRAQADLPGAEAGINPNEVAGMLLWLIPMCASLCLLSLLQFARLRLAIGLAPALALCLCLLAATLLILGELVLVQSRIAYGALLVAGMICLLVASRRRARLFLAALVLAVALLSLLFLRNGMGTAIENLFPTGAVPASLTSLASLRQRVEVWSRALEAIQDFTVIGMGMNTFRKVVHVLYPLQLTGPDVDIAHAHNEFLQAALDLGIPGLIAFLAIYINAFWMFILTWRSAASQPPPSPLGKACPEPGEGGAGGTGPSPFPLGEGGQGVRFSPLLDSPTSVRALVLGLAGGLLAHMLYGLADAVALGAKPGLLFWMLLGLTTALYQRSRERLPAEAEPPEGMPQSSALPESSATGRPPNDTQEAPDSGTGALRFQWRYLPALPPCRTWFPKAIAFRVFRALSNYRDPNVPAAKARVDPLLPGPRP